MRNLSHQNQNQTPLVPKQEIVDFDSPVISTNNNNDIRDNNGASSSGTNVRSTLIAMGFQPSLVNKLIQQKGEDHFDDLLDTLVAFTEGHQRCSSKSSDSLERLFDDKDVVNSPEISSFHHQPKEEPDNEVDNTKRSSLLLMNFSLEEINFAINRLGIDAPIDGLVDFIVASQIAKVTQHTLDHKNEEISNEILFGTMDKTLHLLEMGFSETQVSWAIENCGSELPISELADSIITGRIPVKKSKPTATSCGSFSVGTDCLQSGLVKPETTDLFTDAVPQRMEVNVDTSVFGKEPKLEENDNISFETIPHPFKREENRKGKRPKMEFTDDSNFFLNPTCYYEEKVDPEFNGCGIPRAMPIKPRKPLPGIIARPPYFLYGNVGNLSHESWVKISKFLYNVEPEFLNTREFSALCRNEGYIHNLPSEERFEIDGKPPMTVQDAMPHTKKWWPTWDARKKLDCISSHVNGISQVCDRVTRIMTDSRGFLSSEQQRNIVDQCQSLNLVWVGRNKVGAMEPEYLEMILGYPLNHTDSYGTTVRERVELLQYCFQTDTLGYQLSVLKRMYPEGLTMLCVFGGIGGAEIALDRLGIHMKAVVSVESSESKRKILEKWWRSSGQRGELVQLEHVQKLTSGKLSGFMEKYGSFDLVICQNPSSQQTATCGSISGFDLSLFCEFVRILQRLRGMVDKHRSPPV